MVFLLPLLVAYLLGAVPFGWLVPRWYGVPDIRRHGSGNIGATNVARVCGFRAAIWVYAGDISKGVAAVLIARYLVARFPIAAVPDDTLVLLCALAAVLGHVYPVYLGFRGGKGVNTALGAMIALLPGEALLSLAVFGLVVVTTRYVSLGSMLGALAFFLTLLVEKLVLRSGIASVYLWVAGLMLVLIVVTHRQNIARLVAGTENKVSRAGAARDTTEEKSRSDA